MNVATARPFQQRDSATRPLPRYPRTPGWPTSIEPSTGQVWLRPGDAVDALAMPAGFGGEVNHHLIHAAVDAPIIVVHGRPHARLNGWVFLTRPRTPMRKDTVVDLILAGVRWYEIGAKIPLPTLGREEGLRWLRDLSDSPELPTWAAVVDAARRASRTR